MKLSIVTICFNNPEELTLTINSLINHIENEPDIELIVVDGSTNDSCQKILEKYNIINLKVIYERDDGIYFAMNKGLRNVTGETVIFVNSGDSIFSDFNLKGFLKKYSSKLSKKIIFGDVQYQVESEVFRDEMVGKINGDKWWYKFLPCHQSIFIPAKFYQNHIYDTTQKIGADSKLIRIAFDELEYIYEPSIISTFQLGGVSSHPKTFRHIKVHFNDICSNRSFNLIKKCLIYFSLFRRMVLIKILGIKNYYSITFKLKSLRCFK